MAYIALLVGGGLILFCAAMIWVARPAQGQDCVPWLRSWIVGQVYALTAMISAVLGVTILLTSWPA